MLSEWERNVQSSCNGLIADLACFNLVLRRHWYVQGENGVANSDVELPDLEKRLLFGHGNEQIIRGVWSISENTCLQLAALQLQVERGNCDGMPVAEQELAVSAALHKYYPSHLCEGIPNVAATLGARLRPYWEQLHARSESDCIAEYLAHLARWPYYGYQFFYMQLMREDGRLSLNPRWFGVGERSVVIVDMDSRRVTHELSYRHIMTVNNTKKYISLVHRGKHSGAEMPLERLLLRSSQPSTVAKLVRFYISACAQTPSALAYSNVGT